MARWGHKQRAARRRGEGLNRRAFLMGLGASGAVTLLSSGCGYFPAESCGDAFEPWRFPADERRPEYLAVGAAILAASPHNTQPWRFEISASRVELFADLDKSLGAMDPLHREMYVGLGCALENLVIAAEAHGRAAEVTLMPDVGDEAHVATITLREATSSASPLYAAIPERRTHRGAYVDEPPPDALEAALRALLDEEGDVALHFISDEARKARFREGTLSATRLINDDPEMSADSHRWYRHTCEEMEAHRDGITIDATGQGSTIRCFGKISSPPDSEGAGDYWLSATKDFQLSGAAFCALTTPERLDRASQLRCGRAYQRLHLWAQREGLAMQPLNQMAEIQDRGRALSEPEEMTAALTEIFGAAAETQMLFRVGYAWDPAFASPRRPLKWALK